MRTTITYIINDSSSENLSNPLLIDSERLVNSLIVTAPVGLQLELSALLRPSTLAFIRFLSQAALLSSKDTQTELSQSAILHLRQARCQ